MLRSKLHQIVLVVSLVFLGSCATKKMVRNVILNPADETLEYCVGDADYNGPLLAPTSCDNPEVPKFDKYPIRVAAYPELVGTTVAAIEVWNDWVGFDLFSYSHYDPEADIIVVPDYNQHPRIRAYASHYKLEQRLRGLITTYPVAFDSVETMAHELGHIVGLAHDPDNIRSIMYPNSGRNVPWLEDIDRAIIRDLYL